jgi:hypothetical protein
MKNKDEDDQKDKSADKPTGFEKFLKRTRKGASSKPAAEPV